MKAVDFSYLSCKPRMVNLQIPFLNGVSDFQERTLLLSSFIDLENESLGNRKKSYAQVLIFSHI